MPGVPALGSATAQYFFPGCVESNGTVYMVTGSDGNGNEIIGKWVVDPFCDGNGNGKKQFQIHNHATCPLPLQRVTM